MPPNVELREITRDNLDAILALDVHDHQRGMVASNARSIAQAYFWRDEAYFRAIYADGEPAGFVMLAFEPSDPPYVWRLMIDQRLQGKGVGRAAMRLILPHVRLQRPDAKELLVSHVTAPGDPGPFYEKLGFTYTGAVSDGERIMRLPLP